MISLKEKLRREKIKKNNARYWLGKKRPGVGGVKKGSIPWNKGTAKIWRCRCGNLKKKTSNFCVKCNKGNNHYEWKGAGVGYRGLHNWVINRLGKPDICEHCGKSGLGGHQIHWANKSGEYKRTLEDWIRLCYRCHRIYDGLIIKK